ncbi:MAG TPA: hypothetical protein HA304_03900 [Methanosarcinales archaeon]|nr:hypothetical protein [Methanosarcinales archaeon]
MKLLKKTYLVVMVIALCACAHVASAAPVVSVEPVFTEVAQGEIFTVDIMIDPSGSEEIFGASFELYFDNTLLNGVDKCEEGTFLSHDASTLNIANNFDNTAGKVEYGEMRTGVDYGVTASGILATITFNATGVGACGLTLDNVKLSDSNAQNIPDVLVNEGTCEILAAEHTPTATTATSTATTTATALSKTTATAVQTGTDLIPPLPGPHITETESTITAQTQAHPLEENTPQTGFTSAIAIIGMFIVLYVILRKK